MKYLRLAWYWITKPFRNTGIAAQQLLAMLAEDTKPKENRMSGIRKNEIVIQSPGKYAVAVRGHGYQQVNLYVNNDLLFTLFAQGEVDATITQYFMPGDTLEVANGELGVSKIEYTS